MSALWLDELNQAAAKQALLQATTSTGWKTHAVPQWSRTTLCGVKSAIVTNRVYEWHHSPVGEGCARCRNIAWLAQA